MIPQKESTVILGFQEYSKVAINLTNPDLNVFPPEAKQRKNIGFSCKIMFLNTSVLMMSLCELTLYFLLCDLNFLRQKWIRYGTLELSLPPKEGVFHGDKHLFLLITALEKCNINYCVGSQNK